MAVLLLVVNKMKKIKVDENKANSGLKKFKFGPGIKSNNNGFNKNNKNENNTNKDLLGFGDIIQNNDTNNSSSNNNNVNNTIKQIVNI